MKRAGKESFGMPKTPILERSIRDLGLPTRIVNRLAAADVNCIGDLIQCSESDLRWKVQALGPKSIVRVKEQLADKGLTLGLELADRPRREWEVIDGKWRLQPNHQVGLLLIAPGWLLYGCG